MGQSYVESVMLPEERLVYGGSLHWIIFVPGLVSAIGGAILCLLRPDLLNHILPLGISESIRNYLLALGLAAVLGGVGMLTHAYLRLITTELAVTNRRVVAKTGFISRHTFEIMLIRVEGVNIEQSITGRILGFGTLFVHGTGGGITPISHVASPLTFKKQLMIQVEHAQKGRGIVGN